MNVVLNTLRNVARAYSIKYERLYVKGMFYITEKDGVLSVFPCDHGITYTCSYDKRSKKFSSNFDNFYTRMFRKTLISKDTCQVNVEHIEKRNELLLFYNICDSVFGHSLCKLLHLSKIKQIYNSADIYVISNKNTEHLIPGEFGKIIVDKEFYEIYKVQDLYPLCEEIMQKKGYDRIDFIISDTYPSLTEEDRDYFIKSWRIKEINNRKRVVFYDRRDRRWGKYLQNRRYKFLINKIHQLFPNEFEVYVLGDKTSYDFGDKVIDLRVSEFTKDLEKIWLSVLLNAYCVIGVIGSNMTYCNFLGQASIEIITSPGFPRCYYKFKGQDGLWTYNESYKNFALRNSILADNWRSVFFSHFDALDRFIIIYVATSMYEMKIAAKSRVKIKGSKIPPDIFFPYKCIFKKRMKMKFPKVYEFSRNIKRKVGKLMLS